MKYRCPKCGAIVEDTLKFCPQCGAKLVFPNQVNQPQQPAPQPQYQQPVYQQPAPAPMRETKPAWKKYSVGGAVCNFFYHLFLLAFIVLGVVFPMLILNPSSPLGEFAPIAENNSNTFIALFGADPGSEFYLNFFDFVRLYSLKIIDIFKAGQFVLAILIVLETLLVLVLAIITVLVALGFLGSFFRMLGAGRRAKKKKSSIYNLIASAAVLAGLIFIPTLQLMGADPLSIGIHLDWPVYAAVGCWALAFILMIINRVNVGRVKALR